MLNKTFSKLNILKKELEELKREKKGVSNNIKPAEVKSGKDMPVKVKKNHSEDIINQYTRKPSTDEFEMFAGVFKNFNKTSVQANNIYLNDVYKKILSQRGYKLHEERNITNNSSLNDINISNHKNNSHKEINKKYY